MIPPLLHRLFAIFDRTDRATVDTGDTLHTAVRPFGPTVCPYGDRSCRTNFRTQTASNAGLRHSKRIPADRPMCEKRINPITFESRHTTDLIQTVSLLPADSLDNRSDTPFSRLQLLLLQLLRIDRKAREQDIIIRHLHRIACRQANPSPLERLSHPARRIAGFISTSGHRIDRLSLITGQLQPLDQAKHQHRRPPRMHRKDKKHLFILPKRTGIFVFPLLQYLGYRNHRLVKRPAQRPGHP